MSLYCSLDIETTGLSHDHCDVIELGAVIDLTHEPYSEDTRAEFHCYIVEDLYQGEPYALSMHPEIFKRIAKREEPYRYFSKEEAVYNFSSWLVENWQAASEEAVLFAGKNFGQFDLAFLRKMPGFEESISYQHAVLDPGVLFLNPKKDSRVPNTKECCKRAGLKYSDSHTALEDALQVSALIQKYYAKKTHKGWIWPRQK